MSDKVGRNDPCPCGSGKKFKKCCLEASQSLYLQQDRASAAKKLLQFVEDNFKEQKEQALKKFWGQYWTQKATLPDHMLDTSEDYFNHYFAFDEKLHDGQLIVDEFLAQHEGYVTPAEVNFLQIVRTLSVRLYELTDLVPGISVTLRDLRNDRVVVVSERAGSRTMERYEWYAARVNPSGASGKPELECVLHIPRLYREGVLAQIDEMQASFDGENDQFFKTMAPFFHKVWIGSILNPQLAKLANTDGEGLVFSKSHFDVLNSSAVETALDAEESFSRTEGTNWMWSGKNAQDEDVIVGSLELKAKTLILETNSSKRAERGRKLLESLAGNYLRFRASLHENPTLEAREFLRKAAINDQHFTAGRPGRRSNELPPEINEALTLDYLAKYYRSWLDIPIPALDGQTPRVAANNAKRDKTIGRKLFDLIHGLEGMYESALKNGDPAYDPSWIWDELGFSKTAQKYPPPLAHERLDEFMPGALAVCHSVAEQLRGEPGFDDAKTVFERRDFDANLELKRFLRENEEQAQTDQAQPLDLNLVGRHLYNTTNFLLHRRKTFWVHESLVFMLAQTDVDVTWHDLRLPFPAFAMVFTDRCVLSLAERLISAKKNSPLAGHILKIITAFVTETRDETRSVSISFACDALGADLPTELSYEVPASNDSQVEASLDLIAPQVAVNPEFSSHSPLRSLFQIVLNAILYTTSAGVEPEVVHAGDSTKRATKLDIGDSQQNHTNEQVYFLPGLIDISHIKHIQELDRLHSGRPLLKRFMVRGHWRRPAATWKEQHMRWIKPHWKGPDIASVIEKAYRLKP